MSVISSVPTIIKPTDGASFDFGGLGVHWKIDGPQTGGQFAVVHHPIAPRALAAPLHYHHNKTGEDNADEMRMHPNGTPEFSAAARTP